MKEVDMYSKKRTFGSHGRRKGGWQGGPCPRSGFWNF